MASDAPELRTTEPQPGPGKRLRPGPRARAARPGTGTGGALTDQISGLIAERRAIRAQAPKGTGLSGEDEVRMSALDADIDRLWAELRRSRLPPPAPPPGPRLSTRIRVLR